jgi:hypothetical protein
MLVAAPKDNLVRTFPNRVTVVIETLPWGAMVDSFFIRRSYRQDPRILPWVGLIKGTGDWGSEYLGTWR